MSGISFRVPLSSEEKAAYAQHFNQLDKEQLGIVTGETLKPLFEKSGISPKQLSQIWSICDVDNTGFLSEEQFYAALRMIAHLQLNPNEPITLELYQSPAKRLASFDQGNRIDAARTQSSDFGAGQQQGLQRAGSTMNRLASRNSTGASPSYSVIPVCTPTDYAKFAQLFDRSTDGNGVLPGNKAREIFLKAKLPTQTLGAIWALCDKNNSGSLDKVEFVMAMHLIQLTLQQNPSVQQLPSTLPNYLWNSLNSTASSTVTPLSANNTGFSFTSGNSSVVRHPSVIRKPSLSRLPSSTFSNAAVDWTLTPEKKQQFDGIFDALDKEKKGSLGSNVLVPFFLTSKLGQDVLAAVWDLADIHNSPVFTKVEFAIAMFLIQKKNAGIDLPDVVPDQLLSSPALGLYQQPAETNTNRAPSTEEARHYQPFQPQVQVQKTSNSALDDLLGLNESFTPPPVSAAPSEIQPSTQSSTASVPTTRKFRPTSTFGQTMIPEESSQVQQQQQQQQQQPSSYTQTRAAPPPPPVARNSVLPAVPSFSGLSNRAATTTNIVAAPAVSLSQATTELANLSTQVSSLTTQATKVHEEKTAAQNELSRISNMKASIEKKLVALRSSYDEEVRQTEETQQQLNSIRKENEVLSQQTAVAEANYHAVQSQLEDLQRQLQEAQEEDRQLKEKLTQFNTLSSQLQQQLTEVQENVKAEKSRVDVHSKQLEISEVTATNLQNEIQGLEHTLEIYLSKHQELDDYKKTIETQHAELDNRHKEYVAKAEDITTRETEVNARTTELEKQEQIYREQVSRLQAMFDDLENKKKQFEAVNAEFEKQQIDYADRIQKFSENQMKLAMGEVPDDDYTNDLINKANDLHRTQQTEEEEKTESVFDKDVPTPVSQTEPDDEQNQQLEDQHVNGQVPEQRGTDDEVAAEAMADSFEGSLNEYGIPRTESVTSSTANNPPQSVRDEVDSEPKEGVLPDIEQQLEDDVHHHDIIPEEKETENDFTSKSAATVTTATDEPLPGGWSTGSTLEKAHGSDSDGDSIKKTPVLAPQDKQLRGSEASLETPPIQKLRLDDKDAESYDDESIDNTTSERNGRDSQTTAELADEFEQISHNDVEGNIFHDASSTQNFGNEASPAAPVGNDEWDEIFSGLGNTSAAGQEPDAPIAKTASIQHPVPTSGSLPVSSTSLPPIDRGIAVTPKSLAIEELSSMGFSKEEATKALEKCDWDLDDATNLLLDGS